MENKGVELTDISTAQNPSGQPMNYSTPTNYSQPMNYNQPMSYGQPMVGYAPQPVGGMASQSQSNVTVVNTQPQVQNALRVINNLPGHRPWTSGLFDCTNDMENCLFTCFCYSCAICVLSDRIGEAYCMPCCVPASESNIRTRIRSIGGIQGNMSEDCCVVGYCGLCAACQEARELTAMGL